MARNLDLTALRAFATVAEAGGVTRAAGLLHLTQSAVSMQIKRLEEALSLRLFEREGRRLSLSADGDLLLTYARQMLDLNDEVMGRMTEDAFTGEIRLGVPHDIMYPHIPSVLKSFAAAYPRVKVTLVSSLTRTLIEDFGRGALDVILTTEDGAGRGAETLAKVPLIWFGAKGGTAWREQPIPLAFANGCVFRPVAQQALEAGGLAWEMRVEAEADRAIEASMSADLAISVVLEGTAPPGLEAVPHGGVLPQLPVFNINMYVAQAQGPADALAQMIRTHHKAGVKVA